MNCKICKSSSSLFGQAKVLQKYPVKYYCCTNCGYIQTEEPYWLDEAYSNIITKSDIGLISRNLQMATNTKQLILTCFETTGKFIDYGGGYGMFVRLMRDQGFDFRRHDPLCVNLFADGFDAVAQSNYALLTAWEVFEHLADPLAEIEKMLSFSRNLFFSTLLIQTPPKPLGEWWYYGLEHGQHVSFYSKETLKVIANKFNLKLHFSNGSLNFIGDPSINSKLIGLSLHSRLRWLGMLIAKTQPVSLLESDFHSITGMDLK